MSAALDQNDHLVAGTLPANPAANAVPMRAELPAKKRLASLHAAEGPKDLMSEQAVIAALLWAGSNAPDTLQVATIRDLLNDPSIFAAAEHVEIYRTILELADAGDPADKDAVRIKLTEATKLRDSGGVEYLEELVDSATATSTQALRICSQTLRDLHIRRQMIALAKQLDADARTTKGTPSTLLESAQNSIFQMAGEAAARASFTHISVVAIAQFQKIIDRTPVVKFETGLRDLDALCPLRPRDVTIVAARTSVGKSVLVSQIAMHIAAENSEYAAHYFSLEMAKEKLVHRAISNHAGVLYDKIINGTFDDQEQARLQTATGLLSRKHVTFADSLTQTMASIIQSTKDLQHKLRNPPRGGKPREIGLVVVDTVPLVIPSKKMEGRSKNEQVGAISRGLRYMTQEIPSAHVIGIVQINREAENQKDAAKIPKLHHLKDCGSLEEDADNVLILHREKDDHEAFLDKPAKLIVAKQRDGKRGTILLDVDTRFMRFHTHERFDPKLPTSRRFIDRSQTEDDR
jgi:replicative DNA helicase